MSELRQLDIPVDIDMLESVARDCGFTTSRHTNIKGYSTETLKGDLVIHTNGSEDLGVYNGKLIYDNWHGSAEKALKKIMPKYMDKYITKKLGRRIVHKEENTQQVVYLVQ